MYDSTTVTVGLDVHARSIRLAAVRGDELLEERTLAYDEEAVERVLRGWPRVRCCYEAGPTGFGLYRHLVERGFESEIPHELTEYVRVRKFYDYDEHSRVGAKHGEFVTDEICDRFCVLGNAEQATAKLKELQSVGVDQLNIYLMTQGQEDVLAAYGKDIIPQFAG